MTQLPRTAPLLALALALGAAPAAAQTIPSPFEYIEESQRLGVHVGYLFLSPGVRLNDSTQLDMAPRSAPVVGLRYGVRVGGPLEMQGTLSLVPTERQLWTVVFNSDSTSSSPEAVGTVPSTVVSADVALRLGLTGPRTWKNLAPYVAASVGLAGDLRGRTEQEEEDVPELAQFRFGPSFALGTQLGTDWFPTRRTSLRVEAQGFLWRVTLPQGFAPGRTTGRGEWNPGGALTVGGAIHF
jgi:hypothetical protein